MTVNIKDIGAGADLHRDRAPVRRSARSDLELGTALRMGPGYFPLVLAGAPRRARARHRWSQALRPHGDPDRLAVAWRGLVLILAAPVFFGLTVRGLGFVPARSFARRR